MDEKGVEVVHAFNPATQTVEDYNFPRPGKVNAKSILKLLVLKFAEKKLVRPLAAKSFLICPPPWLKKAP